MKHAWFTPAGFGPADHPTGAVGRDQFSVGQAVAASSAFPALFAPVRLDGSTFRFDPQHTDRYITDAGVYDNLGISGFMEEPFVGKVQSIFVSDATATSEWSAKKPLNLLGNLLRSIDIIQQRAAELQREKAGLPLRDMLGRKADSKVQSAGRFTLFDIAQQDIATEPKVLETVQVHLSDVRTDLDAFSVTEMRALVHHGYSVAWHALNRGGKLTREKQSSFEEWNQRWPRPKPEGETPESELKEVQSASVSRVRLFSCHDVFGALNLTVLLFFLLGPPIIWWRLKVDTDKKVLATREQTTLEVRSQLVKQAEDRIVAYRGSELPEINIQTGLPSAPDTGDPRYDGVEITSLDKVFDLRKWRKVPVEKLENEELEPANQQTIYRLRRDASFNKITFPLKASRGPGIGVYREDLKDFPITVYTKALAEQRDHYSKHVLAEVDLRKLPANVDFPIVIRSTYWNAFQRDIEDAAFKAYTAGQLGTMVVLFREDRVPMRFNFWHLPKDKKDHPNIISPPPFYVIKDASILFEINKPSEGSTYGIVFTWDDSNTGKFSSTKPELDPNLKTTW